MKTATLCTVAVVSLITSPVASFVLPAALTGSSAPSLAASTSGEVGKLWGMQAPARPRIFPNIAPSQTLEIRDTKSYGVSMEHPPRDIHLEPIVAMACAEFKDWSQRTVSRNVQGLAFEFDKRQWQTSVAKWWARAVEADDKARAEFAELALKISEESDPNGSYVREGEWDNIYFDCGAGDCDLVLAPAYVGVVDDCSIRGQWEYTYNERGNTGLEYHAR